MFDPSLHLFVDDHHVRNTFGLAREFFALLKLERPIVEDIPERLACWACVLREPDGRFRMWYQSVYGRPASEMAAAGVWGREREFGFFPERHTAAVPETQLSVVSYAESEDGLAWHRPDLGLVEWRGSRHNNIVLDGAGAGAQSDGSLTNMDTVSVIRDEADPDPQKRYKLICHWETVHVWDNRLSSLERTDGYMDRVWAARAKYLTTSADGFHWNAPLVRIKGCAGGGDYAGVTRDYRNGRYWFNDRAPVGLPGVVHRAAGLCCSSDLYTWPETVEMVLSPGAFEDYGLRYEHHGMVPFNYGDQDLALLEHSIVGAPVTGILCSHRDGESWRRVNGDTPFLTIGPRGSFDDTIVAATRNGPFRVGDELLFFYNGRHYDKDRRTAHIGAASLRLDGFAALTVDQAATRRRGIPAALVTRELVVTEDELMVNISGHRGTARVGLLRADMKPVPGFEVENCLPVPEDCVRGVVRWRERDLISELWGQQVHVLIQMDAGSLYAIRM